MTSEVLSGVGNIRGHTQLSFTWEGFDNPPVTTLGVTIPPHLNINSLA